MSTYLGTIPQWISAIATLMAIFIAWQQLSSIRKNNAIKMILDIEKDLRDRKAKIDEISSKIRQNETEIKMFEIFTDDYLAAHETYFDVLDRLCYCILNGHIKDKEWKEEYRDLIRDTVRTYPKDFVTGTYYNNTLKLYRKWFEEKK